MRVSKYCAVCLTQSRVPDAVLYRHSSQQDKGPMHLPLRSCVVMDYPWFSEDDQERSAGGNLPTVLELGHGWILYNGQ